MTLIYVTQRSCSAQGSLTRIIQDDKFRYSLQVFWRKAFLAHPASLPPSVFPSCVSSFFSRGAVFHLIRPHIIRSHHRPRGCFAPAIRGPTWVRLVWWRYARPSVEALSRRYDLSLEWTRTVLSRQRKKILKRVVVVV